MATTQILLAYCAITSAMTGQERAAMPARAPAAVLLDLSGNLINTVVERPVQRLEPVRDIILDVPVCGRSVTSGQVFTRLLPDPNRAFLVIILQGTAHSETIGLEDQAQLYTHNLLGFEIHQRITIDGKGVRVFPLLAWTGANIDLRCATNYKGQSDTLVSDFARYQFWQDRPQAEKIAAKKGECRLTAQFAQELRPQLDKASRGLNDAFNFLAGLGVSLQPMRWSTTLTHVHGEVGAVASAPVTAPPEILMTSADLTVRLHQSVLNRIAQQNLAGQSYSPADLLRLRDRIFGFLGTKPVETGQDADKIRALLQAFKLTPVTIILSRTAPVEVDVAAGSFTLTLNASGFQLADKKFAARSIRARFRFEIRGTEIALVRDGSVQITPKGPVADDAQETVVSKLLETGFNLFLPERLVVPQITLPLERPIVLNPAYAAMDPGWLTLSWIRDSRR